MYVERTWERKPPPLLQQMALMLLCTTQEYLRVSHHYLVLSKHTLLPNYFKEASILSKNLHTEILRKSSWRDPNLKYSPPSERLDAFETCPSPHFPEGRGDSCSSREHERGSHHSKDPLLPLKGEGSKAYCDPMGSSQEHRSWPALV